MPAPLKMEEGPNDVRSANRGRGALTEMSLPLGPPLPTVIQTLLWAMYPTQLMDWCLRRYGECFTLRLSHVGPLVFLADPAAIKVVFGGDPELLHAGEGNAILEPVVGRQSVLLLDGAEHLRHRRLMLPPFHGERMQHYGERMVEITRRELARWPMGAPVALRPRMQAIALEVIMRLVFGIQETDRLDRVRALLRRALDMASGRLLLFLRLWHPRSETSWGAWARFRRAIARVDAVLLEEIARRRQEPASARRDDILSLLLQARDDNGQRLTDAELRDELMTLLVAGHETTATALAWAFERLLHTPSALGRVERELEQGGGAYLDAVIKETLRLRPVIPVVVRRLTAAMDLRGHALPAGAHVAPCIYLAHRRPDLYANPLAFRPERFLDRPPDPHAWIPFGGGTRRCLGASFATYEMKIVLSTVLSEARLRPLGRPEPIRRRGVTLAPARDALVVLEEWKPSRARGLAAAPLGAR